MPSIILNPAVLAAVIADLDLDIQLPAVPDVGVSVGAADCEPCQAFDGRLSDSDTSALASALNPRSGVSVGEREDGFAGVLKMLGGKPCRMWGEPVPGDCCGRDGDIDPCRAGKKICGSVAHYDVPITGAAQVYELTPHVWFWPLLWQDTSHADTTISTLQFQGKDLGPVPNATIYPATQYPMSVHNIAFGLPAISHQHPLRFTLNDASGTNDGSRYFRGKFIGLEYVAA